MDTFFGFKRLLLLNVFVLLILGCEMLLLPMPAAHADDGSYLSAVSGVYHSVYDNTAMLHFGHGICDDLHSGRTFQQEVEMAPPTMAGYMDVPAVIGAAQHELCPDTLGR